MLFKVQKLFNRIGQGGRMVMSRLMADRVPTHDRALGRAGRAWLLGLQHGRAPMQRSRALFHLGSLGLCRASILL